jgi:hypothetical protein
MSDEPDFKSHRDALVAEITAAFDSVSREDGATLHEAEAIDNRESDDAQREARNLDVEQRWQDVPDAHISECCSALSFLCPLGFRYYIPAFMLYGLRHLEDDPNGILQSCEYHLLHDYPKSLRKSEPAAIASKYGFTDAQCRAVAKFLRFVAGDDITMTGLPTIEAVEKWEKFVQNLHRSEAI